jgi:hypothetical protein
MSFKRLAGNLRRQGYSAKSANAIAYSIWAKKYWKAWMARKAALGRKRKASR